jgi:hypothetical protein
MQSCTVTGSGCQSSSSPSGRRSLSLLRQIYNLKTHIIVILTPGPAPHAAPDRKYTPTVVQSASASLRAAGAAPRTNLVGSYRASAAGPVYVLCCCCSAEHGASGSSPLLHRHCIPNLTVFGPFRHARAATHDMNRDSNGRRRGPPEGYVANAVLSLLGVILNFLAFWWGLALWRNDYFAALESANQVSFDVRLRGRRYLLPHLHPETNLRPLVPTLHNLVLPIRWRARRYAPSHPMPMWKCERRWWFRPCIWIPTSRHQKPRSLWPWSEVVQPTRNAIYVCNADAKALPGAVRIPCTTIHSHYSYMYGPRRRRHAPTMHCKG